MRLAFVVACTVFTVATAHAQKLSDDDYIKRVALIGFRGGGMPHLTKPPTRAPSRALPRRRALCTN
jgi:hypothetical protein